jgi:stress-induced morphogen
MSEIEIEQVIVSRVQAELSDAEVQLRDMTGTRDHWEAVIISIQFEGLRSIARQQRVYKALGELMAGPIHAFTMMTLTPEEAERRGINIQPDQDTNQSAPQGSGLISLE